MSLVNLKSGLASARDGVWGYYLSEFQMVSLSDISLSWRRVLSRVIRFKTFSLLYVCSIFHARLFKNLGERFELVALFLLCFGCLVTVNVLWLFLTVPWVGLQCVIVVFTDRTYLQFLPEQAGGSLQKAVLADFGGGFWK